MIRLNYNNDNDAWDSDYLSLLLCRMILFSSSTLSRIFTWFTQNLQILVPRLPFSYGIAIFIVYWWRQRQPKQRQYQQQQQALAAQHQQQQQQQALAAQQQKQEHQKQPQQLLLCKKNNDNATLNNTNNNNKSSSSRNHSNNNKKNIITPTTKPKSSSMWFLSSSFTNPTVSSPTTSHAAAAAAVLLLSSAPDPSVASHSSSSYSDDNEEDGDQSTIFSSTRSSDTTTSAAAAEDPALQDVLWEQVTPESTRAEKIRFLSACKGDVRAATNKLRSYLDWHTQHAQYEDQVVLPTTTTADDDDNAEVEFVVDDSSSVDIKGGKDEVEADSAPRRRRPEESESDSEAFTTTAEEEVEYSEDPDEDWIIAAALACLARKEPVVPLPQIGRMYAISNNNNNKSTRTQEQEVEEVEDTDYLRDRKGHRIIHILPGRMDDRIVRLQTYALAAALYIDRKLDRHSTECVTVLIDVRSGIGWRNLNGAQLLPFIQATCSLLLRLFPERLAQCIVYPLPPAFEWVWNLVHRRCLDPVTAEKMGMCTGSATMDSPPPLEAMQVYLEQDVILTLERARQASFVYPPSSSSSTTDS